MLTMHWLFKCAGIVVGALVVNNFISSPEMASNGTPIEYLSAITLQSTENDDKIRAVDLWKDNGAVITVIRRPGWSLCREEAAQLSSIKFKLDEKKVGLYAVVHETLGVPEFKTFFKSQVFFDPERKFYGPKERWSGVSGIFKPKALSGIIGAWRHGIEGNMKGEGRLLGGLFVIGPGEQGVIFEHQEKFFGDRASVEDVLKAVEKIQQHH